MRIRAWDLPLRAFHWALAASVLGSVLSVKLGEMEIHGWLGLLALSLLIFRVFWGLWGSETARFRSFLVTPSTTLRYLRSPWPALGHNPLGSWSVLALLGLFSLQAVTGLGTSDDIFFDGPLVAHLSDEWVGRLGWIHTATEPLLYGLVALHVLAIVAYRVLKKEALLPPMIHGDKESLTGEFATASAARDDAGLRWRGLLTYLVALAAVLMANTYLSL
ncbi:MAG: cytochrome b/b6 domain-containing protein [Burkholderiaceae bacterium]